MRLLITGGAGYIGSHLLAEMLPLDHEILVIDNFSNGKREALNRGEATFRMMGFK